MFTISRHAPFLASFSLLAAALLPPLRVLTSSHPLLSSSLLFLVLFLLSHPNVSAILRFTSDSKFSRNASRPKLRPAKKPPPCTQLST
eukprot:755068-Hanusia_phi.AAC.2